MSGAAKTVVWSPDARIHIRAIDRETAIQILQAVDEYLSTGTGDVKKLRPPRDELSASASVTTGYSFTNSASAPSRSRKFATDLTVTTRWIFLYLTQERSGSGVPVDCPILSCHSVPHA